MDGYDCNHLLHSASAKSTGLASLLTRSLSFCPRPDLVVVLETSAPGLLALNVGLSEERLFRQNTVWEQLHFDAGHVLRVDAVSPPSEIARAILQKIAATAPERTHGAAQ